MSDLRKMIALNTLAWEFFAKQDDRTIDALVSGALGLSLSAPAESAPAEADRVEPRGEAKTSGGLAERSSEDQRRAHLSNAGLSVKELKEIAKQNGFTGYSKLPRDRLLDLLASGSPKPVPPPKEPARDDTATDPRAEAIGARLRETETEEQGMLYLDSLRLNRESLLAVAAALGLTRVTRLSLRELKRRVLKQAIGARRKYAGLREW